MFRLLRSPSVATTDDDTRQQEWREEGKIAMTTKTYHYAGKLALALGAVLAALVLASGAALAVNKVCPPGSTQQNPCSGTTGNDLLMGMGGSDYIKGLAGNDKISGGQGSDTTDGGGGSDTYSYKNLWGTDTLTDSGGADALNFSAVDSSDTNGVVVGLRPELGQNFANGPNAERLNLSSGTVVERVTGSSKRDFIYTGGAANTLRPGPGTGGAEFYDYGGCSSPTSCSSPIPTSNDTYSGLSAGGYGSVVVRDHGGTADRLVLPFASTDAYFGASDNDADGAADLLSIETSATDRVVIYGQLEPAFEDQNGQGQDGHIEQIQFTDETMSIGGEGQAQSLGATTAEAQVAALNEVSNLDPTEKERLSKAAKEMIEGSKKDAALPIPSDGGER